MDRRGDEEVEQKSLDRWLNLGWIWGECRVEECSEGLRVQW